MVKMACDRLELEFMFVQAVVLWLFPFSNKFIVCSRLKTLMFIIYWQFVHSLNYNLSIFLLPDIYASFLAKIMINVLRLTEIYNFFIVNFDIGDFDLKLSVG